MDLVKIRLRPGIQGQEATDVKNSPPLLLSSFYGCPPRVEHFRRKGGSGMVRASSTSRTTDPAHPFLSHQERMQWDLWNPGPSGTERHSTHPLVAIA